eukprot:3215536-Pyramimonas_sp.AAC.1
MERGGRLPGPLLMHPDMSPINCRPETIGLPPGRLVENLFVAHAAGRRAEAGLVPQTDEAYVIFP